MTRQMGEPTPARRTAKSQAAIRQLQRRPAPPQPSGASLSWAMATCNSLSVSPSSGTFRPILTQGYASDSAMFAISSGYLQINEPGYYVLKASIVKLGNFNTTSNSYAFLPVAVIGGSPQNIQDNQGIADYFGDYHSARSQYQIADEASFTLTNDLTFNWNPASPVSDLDFENPLKVSALIETTPFLGSSMTLGMHVFVMRIADAGYVTL